MVGRSGNGLGSRAHLCHRPMSIQSVSPTPPALPEGLAAYRLLTSDEAALLLGVPVATLRTWRSRRRGYGPRAVQVGGSIRYRLTDLLAWIDEHTETPDGCVPEGVEASRRGKPSPADLPALTRKRRPTGTTRSGGPRYHQSATAG
jgi:predicted DNA-binding transcriptional regulator AlpA